MNNTSNFNYVSTLEMSPEEIAIVKFVFSKVVQYYENPPEHLVNEVIEDYKERGEILDYDEAATKVSGYRIKEVVCDEVNEKWNDYFSMDHTRVGMIRNTVDETYTKVSFRHEPIIDKETFYKVQAKMVEANENGFCQEDDEEEMC